MVSALVELTSTEVFLIQSIQVSRYPAIRVVTPTVVTIITMKVPLFLRILHKEDKFQPDLRQWLNVLRYGALFTQLLPGSAGARMVGMITKGNAYLSTI